MFFNNSGVFLIIFGSLNAITIPCNETYQAQNGHLCYPCEKGFHKLSDCTEDNIIASCAKCGIDEYQPNCDNSTKCMSCRTHCPSRQEKMKGCSDTSDIVCQCEPGTFWRPDAGKPDEGHCSLHSPCKAGDGVIEKGTPFKDTKCAQCQEGVAYSDKESFYSCTTCSQCNTTLILKCSRTNDTVCDDQNSGVSFRPSPTQRTQSRIGGDVIVGIVLSVVVITCILVALAIYLYRYIRRKSQRDKAPHNIKSNGAVHLPEQSKGENGSKQLCKQNKMKLDDIHNQEVPKYTSQSVSENKPFSGCKNACLVSKDNQRNLIESNKKISESQIMEILENGVLSNSCSADRSLEQAVGNETNFSVVTSGNESSESNDVLSTDADAVPPRNEALQNSIKRECKDETNHRLVTSPTYTNTVDAELPASPGSCNQTIAGTEIDNIRNEHQPQLTEDTVWMEVVDFLVGHLSWHNFIIFFRWLVELTASDNEFSRNKDVVIENTYDEHGRNCRERIYQLIRLWRQATPKSTPRDIVKALEKGNSSYTCGWADSHGDNSLSRGRSGSRGSRSFCGWWSDSRGNSSYFGRRADSRDSRSHSDGRSGPHGDRSHYS